MAESIKVIFSSTRPDASASQMSSLQCELMRQVETALGQRDPAKKLYQPTFGVKNPHVVNTPSLDGAYAELSNNAAGYWPTAAYELAHETVHLLNPVVGNTNYLEEGIAVTFSIAVSTQAGHPMKPSEPAYEEARALVAQLPPSPLEAGKQVRARCGALSKAQLPDLVELFPTVNSSVLKRLCEPCVPNQSPPGTPATEINKV
jgi:hypothetical protein